jgi:hypothetical protein
MASPHGPTLTSSCRCVNYSDPFGLCPIPGTCTQSERGPKACPAAPILSGDATPVKLTDDQGNAVTNAGGSPIRRPAGFDPHFFTGQGASAGKMGFLSLRKFGQGATWDAQRIGGTFHSGFVDDANVNIGLYSAAAGLSENRVLSTANDYAAMRSGFGNAARDLQYTHLRAANVSDIRLGFRLQQTNAICTPH